MSLRTFIRFNPSVGIAFIQTGRPATRSLAVTSFNPSVGIAFIQTSLSRRQRNRKTRFNPSVGIAFIQTATSRKTHPVSHTFQSLSRDSVYSNPTTRASPTRTTTGFNPSVGIAFIQTILSIAEVSGHRVSIPQSG